MGRITIVGSGISGMAIASLLARTHEVTIVAKNLPGDKPSIEWASPWAGASIVLGGVFTDHEKRMQLDAFTELWRLAISNPESSVRHITMEDFFEDLTEEDIWWKDKVPQFAFLPPEKLPQGVNLGVTYTTMVLNPGVFLPWLRYRLENTGVIFRRMHLNALADARSLGHDVLINATGNGPRSLLDIKDEDVVAVRGQTILVKSEYPKLFLRDNGIEYTYVIPRKDGTAILGGVRQPGNSDPKVDVAVERDILRRIHNNLPDYFSPHLEDYEILAHNVGLRTDRSSGIRVEKEVLNGQKVVHAYGFGSGGYIYSFGVARVVRNLVDDFLFPSTAAKL